MLRYHLTRLYRSLTYHTRKSLHLSATITLTVITLLSYKQTILYYTSPTQLVLNLLIDGLLVYPIIYLIKTYD
jgi:hypothetical protein